MKQGIKIEHVSLAVCLSLSCSNRSPQAGWLINSKPFVTVLEAESPNLELGGLASGEDLQPGHPRVEGALRPLGSLSQGH